MDPAQSAELRESLRSLHGELAADIKERWQRDLPFQELISDRWERAARLGFGEGASIYESSYILGDVVAGEETWIGPLCMLDGSGGIEIGHHCSISTGVQIYSHDTVHWALTGGEAKSERSPVKIGDCTFIGANAVVLRGVTIGDQCVIGAGAIVVSDVPDRSVAIGVPAEVRGSVSADGELDIQAAPS